MQAVTSRFSCRLLPVRALLLLLTGGEVFAQGTEEGMICGIVTSRENQRVLASVTVLLEGTKFGTATDARGEFHIGPLPAGSYTVVARLLGFAEWRSDSVAVRPGSTTEVRVTMAESAIPLAEVQVSAERQRHLSGIQTSVLSVSPARAKTLAGVAEDVMRTLQALPGISSPSDFSSQLVIRGSGPDENLIIMDDIEVFNPYRLYGMISMFNPETVSDITLITGGFPAKYGDRLSAVLDVTNREGERGSPVTGNIGASISNANVVISGQAPFDLAGTFVASARRTYYDLILGPIARRTGLVTGDVAFPNFTDFQSKLVLEPSAQHRIIANALFSKDGVDLMSGPDRTMPDSINVLDNTRNDILGFAWHFFPSRNSLSKFTVSWYRNRGITQLDGDFLDPSLNRQLYENGDTAGIRLFNVSFNSDYEFQKTSIGEEISVSLPSHTIEGGAGIDYMESSLTWHFHPDDTFRAILEMRGVAVAEDLVQSQSYNRMHFFFQDKVKIGEALSVQPGLRLDYFDIIGRTYLQPRFNIAYTVDALTSVRAAWGTYRQSPGYEKMLDQFTFFDLGNVPPGTLNAEEATHYVLGFERWINNEWQLSVETYYKRFDDVIVQQILPGTVYETSLIPSGDPHTRAGWTAPVPVAGDSVTTLPVNGATGRSYGIEVLLEKRITRPDDRVSGWIGYSLGRADRIRDNITSPFRFDQRHILDLVLDVAVSSSFSVGVRWKYATNFPYTEPVGIKPRIVDATQNGQQVKVIEVDGKGNVVFDIDRGGEANLNSGRLPPYHRLDVRLTALAGFWGLRWDFYLDVINVYNRANVLNYRNYIRDDLTLGRSAITMLPIFPTLGFSVRF